MKRKGSKYFLIGIFLIFIGLFIPVFFFLSDPFGGSFYYSLFVAGSLIWLAVVSMDNRTHLNLIKWSKAHPHVDFSGETAIITVSRISVFVKMSSGIFLLLSFGLAPWFYFWLVLSGDIFPPFEYWFALCVFLPYVVYMLFYSTAAQRIVVNRHFIKREVRGLGWRSELVSHNPDLDIDVHKSDQAIEFIIANADYSRWSIFGSTQEHFKMKRILIPETRNVPLDALLAWLFPEQQHLLPLMIDLMQSPRSREFHRSNKAQKIRDELTRQQELHRATWKDKGNPA